jgi:hypothetical protein
MEQVPNVPTVQPLAALDGPVGINNIDEGRFYYVHFQDDQFSADYIVKVVSKDNDAGVMKVLPKKYRNPNNLEQWLEPHQEPFAVMGHQGVPLQHAAPANVMPNVPEEYLAWDVEFDTVGVQYLFYVPHQQGGKRKLKTKKAKKKTRKGKGHKGHKVGKHTKRHIKK